MNKNNPELQKNVEEMNQKNLELKQLVDIRD